jgi:nicotinamidase-related amidase
MNFWPTRTVHPFVNRIPAILLTVSVGTILFQAVRVRMPGIEEPLAWRQDQDGLAIDIPARLQDAKRRPSEMAWAFKIEMQGPDRPPEATRPPKAHAERWTDRLQVALSSDTVGVEGVRFCTELPLDSQATEASSTAGTAPASSKDTVSRIVAVKDGRLSILGGTSPPDTKIRFVKVALADPAAAQTPTPSNPTAAAVPGHAPGLEYRYYEGAWEALPEAIVAVPFKKGITPRFDLAAAGRNVGYAFDYRGRLRIEQAGDYTFYTTSDAGSRLKVVGKTVVDNDCSRIRFGFPSPHEAKGTATLEQGLQDVSLVFYTDRFTPEPFLKVEYEGPGVARQVVPADVLYHPAPVPPASRPAIPKPPQQAGAFLNLTLRKQTLAKDPKGLCYWQTLETPVRWRADETMFIIVDMWNKHPFLNGVEAVREMMPWFNDVVKHARTLGVQIIHSPTEPAMGPYHSHPAHQYLASFPTVPLPPALPHDEYPMPLNVDDQGANGPILEVGTTARGYAQIEGLDIVFEENGPKDGICEPLQPVWNLMQARGIRHVIVAGTAANMCVMGKPLGIRNLVCHGIEVVAARDMVRPMYNPASPPYVNMAEATRMMGEYYEKFWCPTVTGRDILQSSARPNGAE